MPSHAYWRIPLVWNILLIPFTAHFIIKFSTFLSEVLKKKRKVELSIIMSIIVIYFSLQIIRIISFSYFSPDDIAAGKFIRELLNQNKKDTKILIGTSDWNYLNVMIASNNPDNFMINENRDPVHPEGSVINPNNNLDKKFLENNIRYLLFEGENYKIFLDSSSIFIKKENFGDWELYRLK